MKNISHKKFALIFVGFIVLASITSSGWARGEGFRGVNQNDLSNVNVNNVNVNVDRNFDGTYPYGAYPAGSYPANGVTIDRNNNNLFNEDSYSN